MEKKNIYDIEVRNLGIFHEKTTLLKNISFSVKKGQTFLLLGPSGSGKTSILETLLGFRTLQQGEIYILEKSLDTVLQDPVPHFAWLPQTLPFDRGTIFEWTEKILGFKKNHAVKKKFSKERFLHLIELLALKENIWEKDVSLLSGGEKQKIGLIFCSLLERDIWILDEPTSALDAESTKKLIQFLQKHEATKLISTHSAAMIDYFSEHISIGKENG